MSLPSKHDAKFEQHWKCWKPSTHADFEHFYSSFHPLDFLKTLFSKLRYDPVRDFVPITQLAKVENVLVVNSSVPAKTVQELIEAAKRRPGTLTFGSPGNSSQAHLKGELLKLLTGIDIVHVP